MNKRKNLKTIHVTIDTRTSHGDLAKEAFVGIYQTSDFSKFKKSFELAVGTVSKNKSMGNVRIAQMKDALRKLGFSPLQHETMFVP